MFSLNYIAEIRAFYDWLPFNSLPSDAQALWHALMYLNNRCALQINSVWYWRVEFTVTNTTLLSILHFSRQQLDRMRNALIQAGRIEYRKGKGNQCGSYRINPFDAKYVTQNVTQPDTQTVTQVWSQTGHNLCTLDNYNNTSTSNDNLSFGVGDGSAQEMQAAVDCYVENRDLSMEVYFGMSAERKQEITVFADKLFSRFALRKPTDLDVYYVFRLTMSSIRDQDGRWEITFPLDKLDLALYAFEQAANVGAAGNWNYINGVCRRLRQRDIETLQQAEEFDDCRQKI